MLVWGAQTMVWSASTGQRALQPFPSDRERRHVEDYTLAPALIKDGIPVLKVTKVRRTVREADDFLEWRIAMSRRNCLHLSPRLVQVVHFAANFTGNS